LDALELDGDSARLEIWLDRGWNGAVHRPTFDVARGFRWKQGPTRVHVQRTHVGIIGQWIDTWAPNDHSWKSKEVAVILEDDISVSPFIYRWLKAAHRHYGRKRYFLGASLTSDEQRTLSEPSVPIVVPRKDTTYLYKCFGAWGLSAKPFRWHRFQMWFH